MLEHVRYLFPRGDPRWWVPIIKGTLWGGEVVIQCGGECFDLRLWRGHEDDRPLMNASQDSECVASWIFEPIACVSISVPP